MKSLVIYSERRNLLDEYKQDDTALSSPSLSTQENRAVAGEKWGNRK